MSAAKQLSRQDVADRVGLQVKSIDTYRRRGVMPEPTGYVGRSPWWSASVIDRWNRQRRRLDQADA